jgi:hypothetical protein
MNLGMLEMADARRVVSTMATPRLEKFCICTEENEMPIRDLTALCMRYPAAQIHATAAMEDEHFVQWVLGDGPGLVEAARKAPQVLDSFIRTESASEDDLVEAVQVVGRALEMLYLVPYQTSVVSSATDVLLHTIAAASPGLKHLSLHSDEAFTSCGVAALTALRSLSHLQLFGCKGLGDDCIAGLAQNLPQLVRLEIDGLEDVSEAALLQFCNCPQVWGHRKKLDLHGARQLGEEGCQELRCSGWGVHKRHI